jgi:hypothetical protein
MKGLLFILFSIEILHSQLYIVAQKLMPIFNFLGNIRVFCRCRPLNADEIEEGASTAIDFESAKDGELIVRGHVSSKKVFKFDSVFSPGEDQGNFVNEDTHLAITNAFNDWFLLLMCRKGI